MTNSVTMLRAMWVGTLFLFLVVGLEAAGAPDIETRVSLEKPTSYISPSSTLEIAKTLVIDKIGLQISKNGSIKSYRFAIYDKRGNVVFEKTAVQASGRGFLEETFGLGREGVRLPENFAWDGKDANGVLVADGEYFYQLSAIDNWGRTTASPPLSVVVDTAPPLIQSLSSDNVVISPEGDGVKDTVTFRHLTGPAWKWSEFILDASQKSIWEHISIAPGDTEQSDLQMPETTMWEPLGMNSSGNGVRLPEGIYRYRLNGLDRAGNAVSSELPFRVSYAGDSVSLRTADGKVRFNPHAGITFIPQITDPKGIASWSLALSSKDTGIVWRRWEELGVPPAEIVFSGQVGEAGIASAGEWLADGEYRAQFTVRFESGLVETNAPLFVVADSSPPRARLTVNTAERVTGADRNIWFGGEKRRELIFSGITETNVDWHLELYADESIMQATKRYSIPGQVLSELKSWQGPKNVEGSHASWEFRWDGRLPEGTKAFGQENLALEAPSNGSLLPDGLWTAVIVGDDLAGNKGESNRVTIVKQSAARPVAAPRLSTSEIQPGVQGAIEQVVVEPGLARVDDIESLALEVFGSDGLVLYHKEAPGMGVLSWQGQKGNGSPAPDGVYPVRVLVWFKNGDEQEIEVGKVRIAGRAANSNNAQSSQNENGRGLIIVDSPVINPIPEDEGIPVSFQFKAWDQGASTHAWHFKIIDVNDRTVWEKSGLGSLPPVIMWNGSDGNGMALPGLGRFEARLELVDAYGNTTDSVVRDFTTGFRAERDAGRWHISLPTILFPGNNPDSFETEAEQRLRSAETIRRLAEKILELPAYRIVVEGHATYAWGYDENSRALEQTLELLPLSLSRAELVRDLLYVQGLSWDRIEVVGKGGADPWSRSMKPEDAWQNRRVELFLEE